MHRNAFPHFQSAGGQEIQGWLTQPEGAGPFATVVETHGGPQLAALDLYSAALQAWLDRGCAYLTINYVARLRWQGSPARRRGNDHGVTVAAVDSRRAGCG